ncbi:MAG: RNA polymerase sigma factor [Myxococcales bacterium]
MTQASSEPSPAIDTETLFVRYATFVATFLFRLGARQQDLDDLVQEVFVAAHRRGGYLPGAASPTSWLARLALEARLADRRSHSRWQRTHHDDLAPQQLVASSASTPEYDLQTRQAALRMQQALDTMDPRTRAIFVLFEIEGQSCESIAAALELKVGTVYSRLHGARKTFFAFTREAQEAPSLSGSKTP